MSIFNLKSAEPFNRPAGKKYILMIEDDNSLTEMYKMKLENEGFFVSCAADGKKGLKAIRDTQPDLVLLDILMPVKDGYDVLEEKKNCTIPHVREIPAIVLTNLASQGDQEEGRRLGAKDWWVKAYNTPAEVAQKVKAFFGTNKAHKAD